ncbi:unnamed protein product [Prunus brigantina]
MLVLFKRGREKLLASQFTRHEETTPMRLWSAPISPNLKVNIDKAWHSPSCRTGVGIIIRNARGAFVGIVAVPFSAEPEIMAEANKALEVFFFFFFFVGSGAGSHLCLF